MKVEAFVVSMVFAVFSYRQALRSTRTRLFLPRERPTSFEPLPGWLLRRTADRHGTTIGRITDHVGLRSGMALLYVGFSFIFSVGFWAKPLVNNANRV
jgi:hypothetical protein